MPATRFAHEAVFYDGEQALLEHVVPFLRAGIEVDEPAMVVLPKAKLDAVRDALGGSAASKRIIYADMSAIGSNPARIIPAWRWFVDAHRGSAVRGVGEPIGPQHHGAHLAEIHRNEALVNVAFAESPLRVLCPYDVGALDASVIDDARRTHPVVDGAPCAHYEPVDPDEPFAAPLPDPVPPVTELAFGDRPLREVRELVTSAGRLIGVREEQLDVLVLAVNEAATNSILHGGGGGGRVRVWQERPFVIAEVSDDGWITDPLVGRRWPAGDEEAGRGLWLANQVCDLVQVHSTRAGTAVRLHVRI